LRVGAPPVAVKTPHAPVRNGLRSIPPAMAGTGPGRDGGPLPGPATGVCVETMRPPRNSPPSASRPL
jgi:hypothetical protein